jgi:DNA-binding transcriptional LysR family regulator
LEGTGITHDILKTIRAVIETRSTHLAYLPEEEFAPHLEEGRLTRVLEDWCPPFLGYHLYYPSRRQPSPAFLLVVDALRMEAPSRPTTERGTFAQAVPVDMRRPAEVVASR